MCDDDEYDDFAIKNTTTLTTCVHKEKLFNKFKDTAVGTTEGVLSLYINIRRRIHFVIAIEEMKMSLVQYYAVNEILPTYLPNIVVTMSQMVYTRTRWV